MRGKYIIPALAALVLLAACKESSAISASLDGSACYPKEAARWISLTDASDNEVVRDPGGPLTIYLDGSASMSGYIRGGTADARHLADLIGMLPTLSGLDHSDTEVLRFDRKISAIKADQLGNMQTEKGYLCPSTNLNCDAQESHIDRALGKIASSDVAELSVLVSDLWLANSSILTTDGVALSGPLDKIFKSGRSIAVYGFESTYSGKVSDLPSGKKGATASRRYLYIVAVGPLKRLQAFSAALQMAPSSTIASDLKSGKARYSLFTLEPTVTSTSQGSSDLDVNNVFTLSSKSLLEKARFLPVRSGVKVPQFQLDKGEVLRSQATNGGSWTASKALRAVPGAVWEGPSKGQTNLFRLVDGECLPNGAGWRKEGELRGGWQNESGDYQLDPTELATLPSGKYLLVGGLRRVSLYSPNSATQWMRDWSFNAASESEALRRPVTPTLNLSELARLLEVSLIRSAQEKPMNVGGFAVAVDIK